MERVTVGGCLRRRGGAEIAAGARPVLDHDLLAPELRELGGNDAPKGVERAAGRERDHHAHGFVRIGLRRRRLRCERGCNRECAGKASMHAVLPGVLADQPIASAMQSAPSLGVPSARAGTTRPDNKAKWIPDSRFEASRNALEVYCEEEAFAFAFALAPWAALTRVLRNEAASLRQSPIDWMCAGS